ncbi:hypothetical protein ACHQM5_000418 [Ranunculus cassubicifolius]
MRNQWRSLLLRSINKSRISSLQSPLINLQAHKVHSNSTHLSTLLARQNVHDFTNPRFRFFSSQSDSDISSKSSSNDDIKTEIKTEIDSVDQKIEGIDYVVVTEILSKANSNDEIETGFKSIDLEISYEVVLDILRNLREKPDIAWKFFNFVLESDNARLSSKSYNEMLVILGRKEYVDEFWGLVEVMQRRGYGISKWVHVRALANFEKEGMVEDVEKLKEIYVAKPEIEKLGYEIRKVVRENDWDVDVQNKLTEMCSTWTNDLVTMVIEHLVVHPNKALMFFWWVEENPDFKHNKLSYNAILKVLGREDCIDKFWRIVNEMKEAGFVMDTTVYDMVMVRFYRRGMMKDAVDLYDYMVNNSTKPSVSDSVYLLRKIVLTKNDIDLDLFARAVKLFSDSGYTLSKITLGSVVKSLISVERVQEVGKVLKAMENCGYVPDSDDYARVIYLLGSVGRSEEAIQIIEEMEATDCKPNSETWTSLITGLCNSLDVDKASSCFQTMIEKTGAAGAGPAFDKLVHRFCWNKRAEDALKLLSEMVDKKELRPLHKTYKTLISKLLGHGKLNEALTLLRLMKNNDYPPYLDPFIAHISKLGSGTDAMRFLRAVSKSRYPSTSVFIRMFEAFFKAGRYSEAQNFLGECPSHIRSHADVLTLFCAQKPEDCVNASPIAA